MHHTLRFGIILALCTAVISGTNNFLSKIAVTVIANPIVFTFLKNAIVAVLLAGIVLAASRSRELRSLTRADAIRLLFIGVVGGGIAFVLFFTGLRETSAVTASFIHKTLFLWVGVLAVPFLRERITWVQGFAFALLFVGTLALGFPSFNLTRAELFILAATILWAVENIVAKQALRTLSSPLVAASRMIIGSLVLLGVVSWQGNVSLLVGLSASQWGWTLLTSTLLTGYVLTWYAALKRAPATLVASLLVPAALVTNVLTAVFTTHTLPVADLLSGVTFTVASILLIRSVRSIGFASSQEPHAVPRA